MNDQYNSCKMSILFWLNKYITIYFFIYNKLDQKKYQMINKKTNKFPNIHEQCTKCEIHKQQSFDKVTKISQFLIVTSHQRSVLQIIKLYMNIFLFYRIPRSWPRKGGVFEVFRLFQERCRSQPDRQSDYSYMSRGRQVRTCSAPISIRFVEGVS